MRTASPCFVVLVLSSVVVVAACGGGHSSSTDAGVVDAETCTPTIGPDARVSCDDATGCDPFLHCGCAEASKCTGGAAGLECAPAGTKLPGDACAVDAECARGSVCVPFFGVTQCLRFCDDAHACPGDQACYVILTDRGAPPAAVATLCGPTCSLLTQNCDQSGVACYVSEKHCQSDEGLCLSSGAGVQGVACTRMGDCAKGHLCIDPGGPAPPICAKICGRKGSEPTCDVGTSCHDLPGHIQTGICLP